MNATVIANPFAGTGRGRLDGERAVALLQARGVAAQLRSTTGPGDATGRAPSESEHLPFFRAFPSSPNPCDWRFDAREYPPR